LSVLIGAVISALVSGIASQPLQASVADLGWLALLGVFQLAIPCLLAVLAARVLPPSEISLLCLLEVVFGVAWVWLGTSEQPQTATVAGVVIVLLTLLAHEAWNLRRHRQLGPWP
jgi:drug/metabolite transporter (DMT)-like permease